jgi:hypothetical protein
LASGPENQETGDAGQALVQAELAPRGFLIGPLAPDPGEDFWVELKGRRAIAEGTFPLRALLQVKGSRALEGETFVDDVPVRQIIRWASQPLPVVMVGVMTTGAPTFHAKSIDAIVAQDLEGRDPTTLNGKTVRVHLPRVADLAALLTDVIEEHHRSMRLILDGVPETDIEQHYFEMLEKKKPGWERIPLASWKVLWKSAPRPPHFAAMLTDLARRAGAEYADTAPRPAFVIFHVYRSLYDAQHNLPVARVDWVDPTHPKAARIAEVIGAVGGFKVRHDQGVAETREFLRAQTASAEEFLAYAEQVGTAFDEVTEVILAGSGGFGVWTDALRRRFQEADTLWNEGPFAPVQNSTLHEALSTYFGALLEHEVVSLYRRDKLAPDVVTRLLRDCESKLRNYRGSWRLFARKSI